MLKERAHGSADDRRGMRPDQAPRATEVIRHGRRLCHYTPTETLLMNWRFHAKNRTRLDGTTTSVMSTIQPTSASPRRLADFISLYAPRPCPAPRTTCTENVAAVVSILFGTPQIGA